MAISWPRVFLLGVLSTLFSISFISSARSSQLFGPLLDIAFATLSLHFLEIKYCRLKLIILVRNLDFEHWDFPPE